MAAMYCSFPCRVRSSDVPHAELLMDFVVGESSMSLALKAVMPGGRSGRKTMEAYDLLLSQLNSGDKTGEGELPFS